MKLDELSFETYYNIQNYSQLVIDLVSDAEDLYTYEKSKDDFGAISYMVDNVLLIIDKNRHYDIKALEILSDILKSEII